MGPQLDSCGRVYQAERKESEAMASMGPQLDSCGRKTTAAAVITSATLQWGRNLTVAEGPTRHQRNAQPELASMGPQLDSCGRDERQRRLEPLAHRFNGAAT